MNRTATRIAALLLCALAVAAAIGNALVRNDANAEPGLSAKLWPGHPAVLRETAMREVGEAAARGQLPAGESLDRVRRLANRAPLEPDPFLVQAALAQKRGDLRGAERLLIEARRRDPRSPAARFMLASLYLQAGAILPGLREMDVLTRFFPQGSNYIVPGLAAYAATPGAIPKLKQLLAESPQLEPRLLSALAADPKNADMILQLSSGRGPINGKPPEWQARLLDSLVADRQYARAYGIWAQLARTEPRPGTLYRPDFTPTPVPPPFNWSLAKAGGGIAEPVPGGGIHVLHYGRDRVVLARQLAVLPAGRYQLSMSVGGNVGLDGQLKWQVRCLPSKKTVFELDLTRSASRPAGQFDVRPGECGAYGFELVGFTQEAPSSVDATITALQLARAG